MNLQTLKEKLAAKIYDASFIIHEQISFALTKQKDKKQLVIITPSNSAVLEHFVGQAEPFDEAQVVRTCSLNHNNAAALRRTLPWLTPTPIGLTTSAGFGDRLGIASPGHVRALTQVLESKGGEIVPIFAQQSIREMVRTKRSAQEVMTDATWGTFEAGWQGAVGADADHLKTFEDINACVEAGFSFYTIDPGEHVDNEAATADTSTLQEKLKNLPWDTLESTLSDFKNIYIDKTKELETSNITFEKDATLRAAVKYAPAVAHVARMYRHLVSKGIPFELEVSVDETDLPTSHLEHAYIASELKRLRVQWVSLAPRSVGSFEKGIDYIGDIQELRRDLAGHAEIARVLGPYKLSLHSGSDKFSVYPIISELTKGVVHLKTAGTSYLEALRVIAVKNAGLFRQILDLGHERFQKDKKSYLLSCDPAKVPMSKDLQDEQLVDLLDVNDSRQVLHVTFGSALDQFKPEIMGVLTEHEEEHYETLKRHFVRHLEPFVRGA